MDVLEAAGYSCTRSAASLKRVGHPSASAAKTWCSAKSRPETGSGSAEMETLQESCSADPVSRKITSIDGETEKRLPDVKEI